MSQRIKINHESDVFLSDQTAEILSITDAGHVLDFQFITLILTKLLVYGCVLIGSLFMNLHFCLILTWQVRSFYVQLILKSIVMVSMSFIALFIGLAMKSSKATIISSFLLIFLTQANIGDFTLKDNLVFPVILTGISVVFAVLSVCHAETKDLM